MKPNNRTVPVIAITGGIACGKSTVALHLNEIGFPVIDADMVSKEITEDGAPVLKDISAILGDKYVSNNHLKRKALAKDVFSDVSVRQKLNDLLHPLIYDELHERIRSQASRNNTPIFLDIPLVFEFHFSDLADEIWTIDIPEQMQLRRLMDRNGLNEKDALDRIHSQITRQERNEKSDLIIMNDGSINDLIKKIDKIIIERGYIVDASSSVI